MANITRFTPFDELFNDMTRGYWVKPLPFPAEADVKIKVEVKESDKAYTVRAEIPGVRKEDIQVDVEKVLHSERYYGMASRSFTLPAEVDEKATVANYKDGLLELTLPKKAGNGSKRISVQ